jgi:hypothetical protein
MNRKLLRYGGQALGSVLILSLPIGNILKLALFLVFWGITFGRLTRREGLVALLACGFSLLDVCAIRRGAFYYLHADVWGLAAYVPVCYSFVVLHPMRLLNGPPSQTKPSWLGYTLAVLFATCYLITAQADMLFWAPGAVLLVALGFFHEPYDLRYVGYLIAFGTVWEYTGVFGGQWAYPHPPAGGVPLWFIPMWGGMGLFFRRLLYPWISFSGAGKGDRSGK